MTDGFVEGNADQANYYNKRWSTFIFFIEWVIPAVFLLIVLIFSAFNYQLHPAFWWIPAIWLCLSVIWELVQNTFLHDI